MAINPRFDDMIHLLAFWLMVALWFLAACPKLPPSELQVGTPLTHRHFLRRAMGTYGPGIKAGEGTFPGPKTPIPGEAAARLPVLRSALLSPCTYGLASECALPEHTWLVLWCRPARLWRQHLSRWQLRIAGS